MKLLELVFLKWITQKPFTLHLFARNADKHRGSEDEGCKITLHHPSSLFIFLPFSDFGWLIEFGSCFYYDQYLSSIMTIPGLLLWPSQGFYDDPAKASMMLALKQKSLSDKPSSTSRETYFSSIITALDWIINTEPFSQFGWREMKGDEGWICAIQPLKPR